MTKLQQVVIVLLAGLALPALAPFTFAAGTNTSGTGTSTAEQRSAAANEILLDNHKIVNMLDDVIAFYDQAGGESLSKQRLIWRRNVERKYGAFFSRAVYRNADQDTRLALTDRFLEQLPDHIEAIRQFNQSATEGVYQGLLNFKYRFPDYKQQRDIYIGVSLFTFDGTVRAVNNNLGIPDTLCLGADVLSGYSADQARIVTVHELFHLYHYSSLLGSAFRLAGSGLVFKQDIFTHLIAAYVPLMVEGMAVAASEQIYPGYPETLYIHFTAEEVEAQEAELVDNARAFLSMIRDGYLPYQYEKWFTGTYEGIPKRGGYLLGYEVTKRALAGMTLEQMARLTPAQLGQEAEAQLSSIVTSGVVLMAANQ
jgi:hypothetical protein